jgi:hypothetical protein
MKNILKNSYYDKFLESLEDEQVFTDVQKRYIANKLAFEAITIHDENFKKLSESYKELLINNEKTRSQFVGMVNFIEKSTNPLIESFKRQGFLKVDPTLKGKNNLVGRTSMVTDMVKYLNTLNGLVVAFYKDIYQIEKVAEKEIQKEKIQASLF